MLAQAGAENARIRLQVPKMPQLLDVATVVRDQLQQIGLIVDLETLDQLAWYVNFRRGDFDATLIGQLPYETPDMPTRMYYSRGIDGMANMFGFGDAAIDALIERSWAEPERATRRQTLLEAQRLMLAARPLIQLFTNTAFSTAWRYVRNRRPGVAGSMAQYNYEQWLDRPDAAN
jgi:ABC-type transport system substrate-binding protein